MRQSLSLAAIAVLLIVQAIHAQVTYYSQGSGSPSTLSNWNTLQGGGGSSPANFTSGDVFVVRAADTLTTTEPWTVSGANAFVNIKGLAHFYANHDVTFQQLLLSGRMTVTSDVSVTVNNGNPTGIDFELDGKLFNSGNVVYGSGATGEVTSNGLYRHAKNGGAIPTFVWDPYSTIEITGVTTQAPTGLNVPVGYFYYNSPSQTLPVDLAPMPANIAQYFEVSSTGSGSISLFSASGSMTVGEYMQTGGTIDLSGVEAVACSLIVSRTGVTKNFFTQSGGTIQTSGAGSTGTIVFTPASNWKQTDVQVAGTVGPGVGYRVTPDSYVLLKSNLSVSAALTIDSLGWVDMFWPTNYVITGSGSVTVNPYGKLSILDAAGLTSSGATGQVRVTGSRSFSDAGGYYYWGNTQVTGNGLPDTLKNYLEVWPDTKVTLSRPTTVTGTLFLGNPLDIAAHDLTVQGPVTKNTASDGITTSGAGRVRRTISGTTTFEFPVGASDATRTPVSVTPAQTSTFEVNVQASFTNAPPIPANAVQRQWNIGVSGSVPSSASYSFEWPASVEGGSFTRGNSSAWQYASGWMEALGGGAAGGSDPYTMSATGVTDFASTAWTIGNGGALPVQLSSMTATASRSGAVLRWTTESEVENVGFEVERRSISEVGMRNAEYQKVGFVAGAGTGTSRREYSFADAPVPGRYAYRLKQIDRNGAVTTSNEAEVEVGIAPMELTLQDGYPNPFNPSTTIEFTLPDDGRAILKVYNMLGQEVAMLVDGELKAGMIHRATFNADRLPSGTYIARLEFGATMLLKRLMLVK